MRRWLPGLMTLAGIGVVYALHRRRTVYPLAETLILQKELLEDQYEGRVRLLKLTGAINLRDLGGYRTVDGRRVKWGMVYRSGSLGRLTDDDLEQLERLNIKLVCDLRHIREVIAEPDRLPSGARYWHMPLIDDNRSRSRKRLRMLIFNPQRLGDLLLETYIEVMLEESASTFGELLRRMVERESLPALFHCTAGKDRTGIAAMLLLLVLGVPEDVIVADYTLSNLYYQDYLAYAEKAVKRYHWLGLRAEEMYPLLVADARTIQAALDYLRTRYGTVEAYLRTAAGVDEKTIAQLRATLLEAVDDESP